MRYVKNSHLLILCLLCILIGHSSAEDQYSKYTLKREAFQHAGLVRLSDIFSLIDEWDIYSVDGYSWQGISNSFDLFRQQNWVIMVDGHRMDLKVFDITNINLLPVSPDQIDSIEVYVRPQQVEDIFSEKGLIHIHTRQIQEGTTLQGLFSVGNETGDPGPYRYTEFWSENVDRIAADESFWLSFRGESGYLGAGYYTQIYYPTDPLIADRNRDIYPYSNPKINTNSYRLRAGLSKLYSHPRMDAFYSQIDDFYFFKPLGREIPVKNDILSVGLIGEMDISKNINVTYKFRYARNTLKKRDNAYDIDFNWENERIYANLHGVYKQSMTTIKLGLALDQIKINTDYLLTQNQINEGVVYGSYRFDQKTGSHLKVDSEIRFNNYKTLFKLSAANLWKLKKNQGVLTTISYSQTMTHVENSLWFWSERGYNFVPDQGGDYTIDGELTPAKQWTLDLSWNRDEDVLPSIKTGIMYRGFIQKNLEEQIFQYDMNSKTVAGPVTIYTGQTGQLAGVYIKLKMNQSPSLHHHLYYRYARTIGNSGRFYQIRNEIPENLFVYRITYNPVKNFSIWAMCKYVSKTYWYDFKEIEYQSESLYSGQVSDVFLIDLAINKWIWKRQIKVDLILRNLLDNKNISYPIGASPDLRFYAQAELYFNFW